MLIAENSHCGTRGEKLGDEVSGAADCAALAQGAEVKAFSLGTRYARGRCYAEGLDVTDAMVAEFNKDRANPPCPGGEWRATTSTTSTSWCRWPPRDATAVPPSQATRAARERS